MALLDIVTTFGQSPVFDLSRGNVGSVLDAVSRTNEFVTPTLGGDTDYPAETDVRDGVVYSIYTGNLELPAEIDVITGVQYGANGTEFTGEAVAGGGGEDIILNVTKGKLLKRMTDKLYFDL